MLLLRRAALPLAAAALSSCEPATNDTENPVRETAETDGADSANDTSGDTAQVLGAGVSHGPMVGAVSNTSAVVWARLAGEGSARLVYGTDPGLDGAVKTEWLTPTESHDWTMQWPIDGLSSHTQYFYRVESGGDPKEGSFTTFPNDDENVNFRFVVFADIASAIAAPAYHAAYNENPAFLLQIGDFDHNDPSALGPGIENWRDMHRRCLGDGPHGQDLLAWILPSIPFFHMWDDHDYGANNAGGDAGYREVATQAFLEYYPVGDRPNPSAGLWYSFRYGQVELFMLDLRSQRDPFDDANIVVKSALAREPIDDDQRDWLERGLLKSTATWKVIVSSSVWNPHSKTNDSWMNYPEEQAELVALVNDHDVHGVMFVSGDIHSGGAIDDGANSWFPELSVPTTNITSSHCTGDCGTWSVGLNDPEGDRSGYGMFDFSYDEASQTHSVTLSAHNGAGETVVEYPIVLE